MKKFLVLIVLILSSTLFNFGVHAQTETDPFQNDQEPVIQDVEGLRAEFREYQQDPDSKHAKFEMVLKSGIDSDRVKITWTLSGTSNFVDTKLTTKTISVQSGKTYSIPVEIIPTGYGVTELRAKAEAFKADSTYLVLVRKNFASNASQEILPLTSQYNQAKTIVIVKNVLVIALIFVVLAVAGLFGFKKFAKWLNRDDRK